MHGGAYHDESNEKSHRKACHDRNPPRVNEETQADSRKGSQQCQAADDREDPTSIFDHVLDP